jgi:hypothetical protein
MFWLYYCYSSITSILFLFCIHFIYGILHRSIIKYFMLILHLWKLDYYDGIRYGRLLIISISINEMETIYVIHHLHQLKTININSRSKDIRSSLQLGITTMAISLLNPPLLKKPHGLLFFVFFILAFSFVLPFDAFVGVGFPRVGLPVCTEK